MKILKYSTLCAFLAPVSLFAATAEEIAENYRAIAHAAYDDSLMTARELQAAVEILANAPNEDNLEQARQAWIAARVPYQQTEVFRFGNAIVDEWEGRVNAWPLDEGLIDYVETDTAQNDENPYAAANIIANPRVNISGNDVDASEITPQLIESLHEFDGIEANVASGYHAIEFLLWGQDLNGTEAGAGARPATDFDPENCTNDNCDRRVAYLQSATDLLVSDLEEMTSNWEEGGAAAEAVNAGDVFTIAFTGMGSLSYGEQAGERMKLGLMLHDPEEEHDCFSDNTHNSHFYDGKGVQNVWLGEYQRVDGSIVSGASLYDYVAERDASVADALSEDIAASMDALGALVESAENGVAYDQLIGAGNPEGNALVQTALDALISQTADIERAASVAKAGEIAIEGSDSLDNPNAVFE